MAPCTAWALALRSADHALPNSTSSHHIGELTPAAAARASASWPVDRPQPYEPTGLGLLMLTYTAAPQCPFPEAVRARPPARPVRWLPPREPTWGASPKAKTPPSAVVIQ